MESGSDYKVLETVLLIALLSQIQKKRSKGRCGCVAYTL